jgi:hypothetical protein
MAESVVRLQSGLGDQLLDNLQEALQPIEAISDPLLRYHHAAEAETLLLHAADWLTDLRAFSAHRLHEGGASYAAIAAKIGLSRARAQQLVNRGREVDAKTAGLLWRHTQLIEEGRELRSQVRTQLDEGRRLRESVARARRLRARNRNLR